MVDAIDYFGFVYIWRDRSTGWFGIGSHYGRLDDGYTSRTGWLRSAIRKRPQDFRRRILFLLRTPDRAELLQQEQRWLSMIDPAHLATAENMRRGTVRYFNAKQYASGGAWNKGRRGVQNYTKIPCEFCCGSFSSGMYAAWHGRMCLRNPKLSDEQRQLRSRKKRRRQPATVAENVNRLPPAQCGVCGLITTRGNIARWHGDNCRPRRQRNDVLARSGDRDQLAAEWR